PAFPPLRANCSVASAREIAVHRPRRSLRSWTRRFLRLKEPIRLFPAEAAGVAGAAPLREAAPRSDIDGCAGRHAGAGSAAVWERGVIPHVVVPCLQASPDRPKPLLR